MNHSKQTMKLAIIVRIVWGGVDSSLSYFRDRNWATGCDVGVGDDEQASSHWMFAFGVTLSEEGLKEWKQDEQIHWHATNVQLRKVLARMDSQ
jgi:hypothetical protein